MDKILYTVNELVEFFVNLGTTFLRYLNMTPAEIAIEAGVDIPIVTTLLDWIASLLNGEPVTVLVLMGELIGVWLTASLLKYFIDFI